MTYGAKLKEKLYHVEGCKSNSHPEELFPARSPGWALPASLHWTVSASLPRSFRCSKLLHGLETFFDHYHLRPTDVFQWKRSVNPIALVKLYPGLLWTWFVTAKIGATSLLIFE